ncbi:Peptidylprolyl isomerase [Durusdinium trenchii]|uniref:Peptidylprolyl isomerase n=1 Tax=Durusdinium trenchii TaxID=1381693 RepID=A0ABP0J6H6_9DINO
MLQAVLKGDLEALKKERGAKVLKFQHVGRSTMRDATKTHILPELEFGLLKDFARELKLGAKERSHLMDMFVDQFLAMEEHMRLEVTVRSLCHSRGVTADYLQFQERFKMKKTLLLIGEVGSIEAHWAQLIQPAVYFFLKEYNVVIIDSPSLGHSRDRWMQYGPAVIRGVLRHLDIAHVSVFSLGLGSCIFYKLVAETPHILSPTHIVYNQDMADLKFVPFEPFDVEVALRDNDIQVWMIYNDEDDTEDPFAYNRHNKGPSRMAESFLKMQARLESERKVTDSERSYDEILVTEKLNVGQRGENPHVQKIWVSRVPVHIFSDEVIGVMAHYLNSQPSSVQDDVVDGLVKDLVDYFREDIKEVMELPALKNCLLGRTDKVRKSTAAANRRRMEAIQDSMLALTDAPKVETLTLSRNGTGKSASKLQRTKSNLTVLSEDQPMDPDEEEESLFDEPDEDYRARWARLKPIRDRSAASLRPRALPSLTRNASRGGLSS